MKRIEIAAQGDHFDHIRELYTQMLRKQLERGNNGLSKQVSDPHHRGTGQQTARARFPGSSWTPSTISRSWALWQKSLAARSGWKCSTASCTRTGNGLPLNGAGLPLPACRSRILSHLLLSASVKQGSSRWRINSVLCPFCRSTHRKWMTVCSLNCWIRTAGCLSASISAAWIRTRRSKRSSGRSPTLTV